MITREQIVALLRPVMWDYFAAQVEQKATAILALFASDQAALVAENERLRELGNEAVRIGREHVQEVIDLRARVATLEAEKEQALDACDERRRMIEEDLQPAIRRLQAHAVEAIKKIATLEAEGRRKDGVIEIVTKILDGQDDGQGFNIEPWATVRRRLLAMTEQTAELGAVIAAARTVSTDLAQDCLEDPVGWHEREESGWRRLAVSASNRLRDALAAIDATPPEGT